MDKNSNEFHYITTVKSGTKCILEKLPAMSSGLYWTKIEAIEVYAMEKQIDSTFKVWHDWLGHPESMMMRKIIENSCGHTLKN